MPSTYTTNNGIEKIGDGEQAGLWGQTTNNNFDILDRAVDGVVAINLSTTTFTLQTQLGVLSDGHNHAIIFTGILSGPATITVDPNTAQKVYIIRNQTNHALEITQGSGSTTTINAGRTGLVLCNGAGAGAATVDILSLLNGATSANTPAALVQRDGSGNFAAGTITANLNGTATSLATARLIGGVAFDGTDDIVLPGVDATGNQNTTGSAATLATPRTFTIGATGKSFNGSASVSWTVAEVDPQLSAFAGLSAAGLVARTATNTVAARTVTGTTNQIAVTNGDAVAGNPTIAAVVATQAEAQAGADNVKLMTSLRVRESISHVQLGSNQTWQNVAGSRVHGTSYQNTTGRPIMVAFSGSGSSGLADMFQVSSNNSTWITVATRSDASINHATVIIPANWWYRAVNTPSNITWAELR